MPNPAAPPIREPITEFATLSLAPRQFSLFYRSVISLQFPLKVADVLELRYLVNHAADRFEEPSPTPDYRHFCERMLELMDGLAIHNKRHRERMLRIVAMLREQHYAHSIASRDEEARLRGAIARNRKARAQSVRYGRFFLFAMVASTVFWYLQPEPGWLVKLTAAVSAFVAWDNFHALPILDRSHEELTNQLNDALRRRIARMDWRRLIDRLSLVLGYRHPRGLTVFLPDEETTQPHGRTYH